jgi:hypothetical protein
MDNGAKKEHGGDKVVAMCEQMEVSSHHSNKRHTKITHNVSLHQAHAYVQTTSN